ncbi:MAG: metallophosphoesterase, partial [Promethearchaeota archaeon]
MKLRFIYLLIFVFIVVPLILDISIGFKYQGIPSITSSNNWYFLALGDTRNWGENDSNPVRAALTNSLVENNPNLEFILHSGDMVNRGGEQADWDRYYEDIENATINNIDFYYAVGNHEYYTYNLPDGSYGPPDEDLSCYLANVELPGNEI